MGPPGYARAHPSARGRDGIPRQHVYVDSRRHQFCKSISTGPVTQFGSYIGHQPISGDYKFLGACEPIVAQLSFGPALAGFGHRRSAGVGNDGTRERAEVAIGGWTKLRCYCPAIRSDFNRTWRTHREAFRHQPFSSGSVSCGDSDGIERSRARHDRTAIFARLDDYLFLERSLRPGATYSSGVPREARPFDYFPPRCERNVRLGRKVRKTLQIIFQRIIPASGKVNPGRDARARGTGDSGNAAIYLCTLRLANQNRLYSQRAGQTADKV